MSTFAAKLAGGLPKGAGPQQQPGGGRAGSQSGAAVSQNAPGRQQVGFNVNTGNDRLAFIGNVLIGYKVEVQVKSGVVYEAVFSSMTTEGSSASIVLKFAKKIKDPKDSASDRTALAERPVPVVTIPTADLVQLTAKDVRMSPEDLSGADRSDFGFETDAAISRGRGGGMRELQRWQPEEGDDTTFFGLEDAGTSGWDQFAVNRDRFGVETTWNEHFYTTKIDRGACKISEADAERIAREIERGVTTGVTTNIHLLEERGGELGDDVDEEALYGAVIREPAGPAGHHQHQHPQQQQRGGMRGPRGMDGPGGGAPPRSAWGRAGSGVAAVAGQLTAGQLAGQAIQQQLAAAAAANAASAASKASQPVPVPSAGAKAASASPDGGAAAAAGTGTSPIDIDARKEVNKVRSSLTVGPKKDRSSPYGTPKLGMSRSPVFASPLVADPVSFSALDLDPGAPQVKLDPEAKAEFLRFKEEMNKRRAAGQMGAEAAIADLKKSSSSFKDRPAAPAGGALAAAAAPANGSAAASDGGSAAAPAAAAAADGAAPAEGDAAKAAPVANGTDAAKPAAAAAKPVLTSKLNPNAKPFSLNINAKEFVPNFGAAKAAAPAAPAAPAPAATPAPAAAPAAAAAAAASAASAASSSNAAANPQAAAAAAQGVVAAALGPNGGFAGQGGHGGQGHHHHHHGPGQGSSSGQHGVGGGMGHGALHGTGQQGYGGHHAGVHHGHGGHGQGHVQQGGGGGGHHERGGYGHGGGMGRGGDGGHGPVYHRGDSFRSGGEGGGGGGYRGGGGEHGYRGGGGEGYHHHHSQQQSHHKGGAGGGGDHHGGGKGAGGEHGGGGAAGGLHKVPPPPPQGHVASDGTQLTPMMINGAVGTMATPHGLVPMVSTPAGMQPMGAVPYGVVMAPPGSYMASAMQGAVMASTPGGVPIMYAVRPAGGGPAMMAAPGHVAMMGPAPGMAGPYGPAAAYMTAGPGSMPPPSPTTGRPQSTGYFQTAGAYPVMAAASHPGAHQHQHPGQHPHGHPGQGGAGGHGGGPMMGHGHGPMGHGGPHMQDGRMGGGGGMGPGGGGPKGGRNMGGGGGGHRPPRGEGALG